MTATEKLTHLARLVAVEEERVRKEFPTLAAGTALIRKTGALRIADAITTEATRRVYAKVAT